MNAIDALFARTSKVDDNLSFNSFMQRAVKDATAEAAKQDSEYVWVDGLGWTRKN